MRKPRITIWIPCPICTERAAAAPESKKPTKGETAGTIKDGQFVSNGLKPLASGKRSPMPWMVAPGGTDGGKMN